jgi:hypothetical protein
MGAMRACVGECMRRYVERISVRPAVAMCAAVLAFVTAGLPVPASGAPGQAIAREARKEQLSENAQLKFTREDGSALVEYGPATGTYDAPVSTILTIHSSSVTATVTIFPKGGSITGTAQANYIVKGSVGYFGGNFTITHGTGSYRHVSGRALGISGTINRETFAMTVKAHGEISL